MMRIRTVPLVVMAQPFFVSKVVPPPCNVPNPEEGGVTTHCANAEWPNMVIRNAVTANTIPGFLIVDAVSVCGPSLFRDVSCLIA